MTSVALALASAFGVGYAPFAPGTCGSLVGLVVWVLLPGSALAQGVAIIALFVVGSWSGTVARQPHDRNRHRQVWA
jgi:phosphatidylglycerophosphatase A